MLSSPLCVECGKRRTAATRKKPDGTHYYKKKCNVCSGYKMANVSGSRRAYYKVAIDRKLELMACEMCGFNAVRPCQLDIDHIDGNKKNNDPSNLQILCANCHRLKTFENNENLNLNKRGA